MSDTLSLGPVNIPAWILPWLVSAAVLWIVLRLALNKDPGLFRFWETLLIRSFNAYLILWKLSPLVTDFSRIIRDPVMLLYLPGNLWGHGAGLLAVSVLLFLGIRRGRPALVPSLKALGLGLASSALALGAVWLLLTPSSRALEAVAEERLPVPGALVPEFSLQDFQGQVYDISAQEGKVVFLNFWATWCPPCRAEIPDMVEFVENIPQEDWAERVEVWGINLMTSEPNAGAVQAFMEEFSINFPIPVDETGAVAQMFQVSAIPTTYVIGPDGRVRERKTGIMDRAWMEDTVRRILGL